VPPILDPLADLVRGIPPNLKLAIALALPVIAVVWCDRLLRQMVRRDVVRERINVAAIHALAAQARRSEQLSEELSEPHSEPRSGQRSDQSPG